MMIEWLEESEEDEIIDLYEDIEEYEIKESYITMVDYAERQFRKAIDKTIYNYNVVGDFYLDG